MELLIKGNLSKEKETVKVFGNQVINRMLKYMKGLILMIRKMARVSICGNLEIDIKDSLRMIIVMDMGRCPGEMAQATKANG